MATEEFNVSAMTKNAPASERFLELRNIQKWFGGVHALRGIDLALNLGEAYHLLGENGCGKSTVIKIMSGAIAPSEGEIILDGRSYTALDPIQSLGAGIETVYQDLSLIPNLTLAENVSLSEHLVGVHGRLARLFDRSRLRQTAERALSTVGLPTDEHRVDPDAAEVVDDHADPHVGAVREEVVEQRGLARAQKAGQDSDGEFFRGI